MHNVDVLAIARVEFRDAVHWYRNHSSRASRRFALAVKSAIASIRDNPDQHPRWDERYRYYLLRKFPYYVAYRIESDTIVVVAVFHTSRDSSAWTER